MKYLLIFLTLFLIGCSETPVTPTIQPVTTQTTAKTVIEPVKFVTINGTQYRYINLSIEWVDGVQVLQLYDGVCGLSFLTKDIQTLFLE